MLTIRPCFCGWKSCLSRRETLQYQMTIILKSMLRGVQGGNNDTFNLEGKILMEGGSISEISCIFALLLVSNIYYYHDKKQ